MKEPIYPYEEEADADVLDDFRLEKTNWFLQHGKLFRLLRNVFLVATVGFFFGLIVLFVLNQKGKIETTFSQGVILFGIFLILGGLFSLLRAILGWIDRKLFGHNSGDDIIERSKAVNKSTSVLSIVTSFIFAGLGCGLGLFFLVLAIFAGEGW